MTFVTIPPEEIVFEKAVNPLATEYTFGPEEQFWAFDYSTSKDGEYMMIAFGACDANQEASIVQEVFHMEVAYLAAREAVQIALEMLQQWKKEFEPGMDLQKETDWIKDTFLKDVEEVVDIWTAAQAKNENKLH